jgi:hypothetical protein
MIDDTTKNVIYGIMVVWALGIIVFSVLKLKEYKKGK